MRSSTARRLGALGVSTDNSAGHASSGVLGSTFPLVTPAPTVKVRPKGKIVKASRARAPSAWGRVVAEPAATTTAALQKRRT